MYRQVDPTAHSPTREIDGAIGQARVKVSGVSRAFAATDVRPGRLHGQSIVIATDAREDSDGAVRAGIALAQRDGGRAELLSVVEPPTANPVDGTTVATDAGLAKLMSDARSEELLAQRDRTFPAAFSWPATIEAGDRVSHIAGSVSAKRAGLIVLGLGAHGLLARVMGRETALRVIRAAEVPVLAVPRHGWGVPHSVIAAVDFTPASERAARAALDLLGGEGKLYLAHVEPYPTFLAGGAVSWTNEKTPRPLDRLRELELRLDAPRDVMVELVVLHGAPAQALVSLAEREHVDLIAAGSHGRSMVGRILLGSVSTGIVRAAHCWVLVAPPAAPGDPLSGTSPGAQLSQSPD